MMRDDNQRFIEAAYAESDAQDLAKALAEEDVVSMAILDPYRVVHDGVAYLPGQTAAVPASVGDWWTTNGWAEPAPEQKGKRR